MDDLERWKSIARKATRRAARLDLALENIEQSDPELVEHALVWADTQLAPQKVSND